MEFNGRDKMMRDRESSDHAAFRELWLSHAPVVQGHLLMSTGNLADAEDLLQEVLLVAWRRRSDPARARASSDIAWLLTIANYQLRQRSRTLSRSEALIDRVGGQLEPYHPDHAEQIAEQAYRGFVVNGLLNQMSTGDQEILRWCVAEGFSPAEVARMTGQKPSTVTSRLSRALKRARALFDHRPLTSTQEGNHVDSAR